MSAQNNRDTGETIMEEKIPDTTEKTEAKKGSGQFAAAPIILFAISSAHLIYRIWVRGGLRVGDYVFLAVMLILIVYLFVKWLLMRRKKKEDKHG